MTKEQLIKEFRERFTFQKGGVWMDGKTYMVPFEIQAFLLSAFDAGEKNGIEIGRASGIEEVKNNKMPCENHTIYSESCVACQESNELTPSSSKDN